MTTGTQPRDGSGRFAERLDVGVQRRMTELLNASLGHPGTADGEQAASDAPADLDALAARQEAALAALAEATVEVVQAEPVDAGELVGAKSLEQMLAEQESALSALEGKTAVATADEVSPEDEAETPETDLFGEPVVEEKIRRPGEWDPDAHPRDRRGRFATIGSTVSLPESLGGGSATVLRASGGGNIRVRKGDGTEIDVPARDTEVTRSASANAAERSFANRAGAESFGGFQAPGAAPTRAPASAAATAPPDKPGEVNVNRLSAEASDAGQAADALSRTAKTPDEHAAAAAAHRDAARRHTELAPHLGSGASNARYNASQHEQAAAEHDRQAGEAAPPKDEPVAAPAAEPVSQPPTPKPMSRAVADALDDPLTSLQDAATNRRQRREAEVVGEAQSALRGEGTPLTASERVELADELDRIAEDSLAGDEGDPRVAELRAAAAALRGEPDAPVAGIGPDGKPGADLAGDDGIDRSTWTGGQAPNGARGTGVRPDGTPWGTGYDNPADPRNDPAYDQYTAELDAKLDKALAEIGDTEALHDRVEGVPGAYRPDREAEHEALLAELMGSFADVPRENRAIVMAGPPGAGKSTVIKTDGAAFGVQVDAEGVPLNYAVVNPDDMKELLAQRGMIPKEYLDAGIGQGETATFLHEESSHLAARLLTRLKAEGYNVLLDGTFSGNPDKQAGKVHQLRADGYAVTGVLVDGTVDRSLANAARRHRKPPETPGGAYAGRYVPYGLIETNRPTAGAESTVFGRPHRNKASENIERVQDAFDNGVLWYDNSTGRSTLVHRVGPGQEVTAGTDVAKKGVDRSDTVTLEGKAGGADRNRGNAERLRRYWTHGEGAAEIRWGEDGDHMRCVRLVVEHAEFTEEQAHGYCNLREKEATGQYPAQHAARSKALFDHFGLRWAGIDLGSLADVKATPAPATDGGAIPNENPEPKGVMVALYPPDDLAQHLHLDAPEAEDVSSLHVTLAYLGSTDDVGLERVGELVQLVADFAAQSYAVDAEISGVARWGAGEDGDAFVALVDAPDLDDLRADLVDDLTEAGFAPRTEHGFTPHVTLAYVDPAAPSPLERVESLPGTFGWLSVAYGPDVWDFPLGAEDSGRIPSDAGRNPSAVGADAPADTAPTAAAGAGA